MLLFFRLYRRHLVHSPQDAIFTADLCNFSDIVVHLRESEADYLHIYDLEIIPMQITADKIKANDDLTMSSMNMDFAVFIKQTIDPGSLSVCWFSFVELWHFLHNKHTIQTISVDERMAGHFIRWETLLAQSNIKKKTTKIQQGFLPAPASRCAHHTISWPIDKNTIFTSAIGLWYFIFSSPHENRALFLERLLQKGIYPTISRLMVPNEISSTTDPTKIKSRKPSPPTIRTASWRTRCVNFLCKPCVSSTAEEDEEPCLPQLIHHCHYLGAQVQILERQVIALQKNRQRCSQCGRSRPAAKEPTNPQIIPHETTV